VSGNSHRDVPGVWLPAWLVGLFVVAPLAIAAIKLSNLPVADLLARTISLEALPAEVTAQLRLVLLVPVGAVVVVLFRLTLGIRVLGPFRPILIAIALQLTGLVAGLAFLILVMATIAIIRPLVRGAGLPYFARVAVLVSTVAVFVITAVLASDWLQMEQLLRVAFFPIVVLCLVAESFARTLHDEGAGSAVWRAVMTILAALLINAIAALPGLLNSLLAFPELTLLTLAMVVTVAKRLDLRLLATLNPAPRCAHDERVAGHRPTRKRSRKKAAARDAAMKSSMKSPRRTGRASLPSQPIHS
jgi:hypothetical protein